MEDYAKFWVNLKITFCINLLMNTFIFFKKKPKSWKDFKICIFLIAITNTTKLTLIKGDSWILFTLHIWIPLSKADKILPQLLSVSKYEQSFVTSGVD